MWVKICGTTNLDDALLAARLGADAIGFVFAPSVRQVTPDQVAAIAPHLPSHVERVGVFPAWAAEKIVAAAQMARLTAVQLHSEFDPQLAGSLRRSMPPGTTLIQALHWTVGPHQPDAAATIMGKLQFVMTSEAIDHALVDSKVGDATGGTSTAFDWDAAQSLFAHPGLILAGGLNPQNVREAVKKLHPWGVDVASGVEFVAGKKDPEKLKRFIAEAKCL